MDLMMRHTYAGKTLRLNPRTSERDVRGAPPRRSLRAELRSVLPREKSMDEAVSCIGEAVHSMQDAMLSMQVRIERTNAAVQGMAEGLDSQGKMMRSLQQRIHALNAKRSRVGREPEARSGPMAASFPAFPRARSPRKLRLLQSTRSCVAVPAPTSLEACIDMMNNDIRRSLSNHEDIYCNRQGGSSRTPNHLLVGSGVLSQSNQPSVSDTSDASFCCDLQRNPYQFHQSIEYPSVVHSSPEQLSHHNQGRIQRLIVNYALTQSNMSDQWGVVSDDVFQRTQHVVTDSIPSDVITENYRHSGPVSSSIDTYSQSIQSPNTVPTTTDQQTDDQGKSINRRLCPPSCQQTDDHGKSINIRPCPPTSQQTGGPGNSVNQGPCPPACQQTDNSGNFINRGPCPSTCQKTDNPENYINRRPCPPTCQQADGLGNSINRRLCHPTCKLSDAPVVPNNKSPNELSTKYVTLTNPRPLPPDSQIHTTSSTTTSKQPYFPHGQLTPSVPVAPINPVIPNSKSPNDLSTKYVTLTNSRPLPPDGQIHTTSSTTTSQQPYLPYGQLTPSFPVAPINQSHSSLHGKTTQRLSTPSIKRPHTPPSNNTNIPDSSGKTSQHPTFLSVFEKPNSLLDSSRRIPTKNAEISHSISEPGEPEISVKRLDSICRIGSKAGGDIVRIIANIVQTDKDTTQTDDKTVPVIEPDASTVLKTSETSETTFRGSQTSSCTSERSSYYASTEPDTPCPCVSRNRQNVAILVEPTSICPKSVTRHVCCNRNTYDTFRYPIPAVSPPPKVANPPFFEPSSTNPQICAISCCREHQLQMCPKLGRALNANIHDGTIQAIQQLLDAGANVNYASGAKWTPLHRAAAKANAEVMILLLRRGACVDAKTSFGFTPLHIAAYNDFSGRCVTLLIDAGANVLLWNRAGKTALHLAAENGNAAAIRALIQAGASKLAKDTKGMSPVDVAKTACIRKLLR